MKAALRLTSCAMIGRRDRSRPPIEAVALRDVTVTIEIIPLIALDHEQDDAEGIDALVLDVKSAGRLHEDRCRLTASRRVAGAIGQGVRVRTEPSSPAMDAPVGSAWATPSKSRSLEVPGARTADDRCLDGSGRRMWGSSAQRGTMARRQARPPAFLGHGPRRSAGSSVPGRHIPASWTIHPTARSGRDRRRIGGRSGYVAESTRSCWPRVRSSSARGRDKVETTSIRRWGYREVGAAAGQAAIRPWSCLTLQSPSDAARPLAARAIVIDDSPPARRPQIIAHIS